MSAAARGLAAALLFALAPACGGATVRVCNVCPVGTSVVPASASQARRIRLERAVQVSAVPVSVEVQPACLECPAAGAEIEPGVVCAPMRTTEAQAALRDCYCQAGGSDAALASVHFQLAVTADGAARGAPGALGVSVEPANEALATCVRGVLAGLSFCRSRTGPVDVDLQLAFASDIRDACPAPGGGP